MNASASRVTNELNSRAKKHSLEILPGICPAKKNAARGGVRTSNAAVRPAAERRQPVILLRDILFVLGRALERDLVGDKDHLATLLDQRPGHDRLRLVLEQVRDFLLCAITFIRVAFGFSTA